jgi:hypothetical protein
VLNEFPDEIALANPALNRALAPIARLLGHRALYPRNWVADQLSPSSAGRPPGSTSTAG